jgi:hypothetical protein
MRRISNRILFLFPAWALLGLLPLNSQAQEQFEAKIEINSIFKSSAGMTEERTETYEGSYSESDVKGLMDKDKDNPELIRKKITVEKKLEKGRREINTYYFNRDEITNLSEQEGKQSDSFFEFRNNDATDDFERFRSFRFTLPGTTMEWEDFMPSLSLEGWNLEGMRQGFGSTNRRFLGVHTENQTSAEGVLVKEVVPDSPAEKAGIRVGDILLSVNDQGLTDAASLSQIIQQLPEGSSAVIRLNRNGEEMVLVAQPVQRPETDTDRLWNEWNFARPGQMTPDTAPEKKRFRLFQNREDNQKVRLGVTVESMVNYKGLKVMEVTPGSPAAKAGLEPFDVIEKFDKIKVNEVKQLQSLVSDKVGEEVTMHIRRNGKKMKKKVLLQ